VHHPSYLRLSATTSPPSSHPVRSFHTALCFTVALHRQCFHFVLFQLTYTPYKRRAAMASNSTGIPLHCNICPKRPNFSDVSHLLTHIASKGHLSNYYKVKVRSSHEDASRRIIDAYDRWYAEWAVEELMSDRMNQKDKRRSRARPIGMASILQRAAAPLVVTDLHLYSPSHSHARDRSARPAAHASRCRWQSP
jgi:hypothetical protein